MALNEAAKRIIGISTKLSDRHMRRYVRLRTELELWCDQQDHYSKGESPTTAAIRKIILDTWEEPTDEDISKDKEG